MCCYADYATEKHVFVKKIKTSKMSLFLDIWTDPLANLEQPLQGHANLGVYLF
jgi:hypothetical protein